MLYQPALAGRDLAASPGRSKKTPTVAAPQPNAAVMRLAEPVAGGRADYQGRFAPALYFALALYIGDLFAHVFGAAFGVGGNAEKSFYFGFYYHSVSFFLKKFFAPEAAEVSLCGFACTE